MILDAFQPRTTVRDSAKAEAAGVMLDVIHDCFSPEERVEALWAHLSVVTGLLAHEVGVLNARDILRNTVRALEVQHA